ncbi:DUF6397 family protein [Streptomyces caelestis]|uniref:DUF6397 family protein n=1 Tax=Streptomyces caelestis TaxID=36816 RepID=UPI00364FD8F0
MTKTRFTRLARPGPLVPVRFRLPRHHAVVRLRPAEEPRLSAADDRNAPLLTRRTPESLRRLLDTGADLRPRNRRTRQPGFLLRRAGSPWARAGAVASPLDPLHVAEAVPDPCDRSHLNRIRRPPASHGGPGSPAANLAEEPVTAQDPDEVARLRAGPTRPTEEARAHRPAPRPACRRPGPAEAGGRRAGPRDVPRPAGPVAARKPVTYSARNSPSWTTDTSIRPSRS